MNEKLGKERMAEVLSRESPFSKKEVLERGRFTEGGDYETVVIGDFQLFHRTEDCLATLDAPLYSFGGGFEERLIELE